MIPMQQLMSLSTSYMRENHPINVSVSQQQALLRDGGNKI